LHDQLNTSKSLETLEILSNSFGLGECIKLLRSHRNGLLDIEHGACTLVRLSNLDISLLSLHTFVSISSMLEERLQQVGRLKKLAISSCMVPGLGLDHIRSQGRSDKGLRIL